MPAQLCLAEPALDRRGSQEREARLKQFFRIRSAAALASRPRWRRMSDAMEEWLEPARTARRSGVERWLTPRSRRPRAIDLAASVAGVAVPAARHAIDGCVPPLTTASWFLRTYYPCGGFTSSSFRWAGSRWSDGRPHTVRLARRPPEPGWREPATQTSKRYPSRAVAVAGISKIPATSRMAIEAPEVSRSVFRVLGYGWGHAPGARTCAESVRASAASGPETIVTRLAPTYDERVGCEPTRGHFRSEGPHRPKEGIPIVMARLRSIRVRLTAPSCTPRLAAVLAASILMLVYAWRDAPAYPAIRRGVLSYDIGFDPRSSRPPISTATGIRI